MKRLALLAAALATLPAAALADTVGTYLMRDAAQAGKQMTMTVSYKNDQAIRMDVGQGTYVLVTGAKVYTVTNQGGQLTVIDMDTLPKIAQPAAKQVNPANVKVTKTGRTETIAGIKGDVYTMTWEKETHDAVMSADKRVQGLNKAFVALAKRMGQSLGADTSAQINLAIEKAKQYGNLGLLRSDQTMVLQSVAEKSQPASYYQLPAGAKPMVIPTMPGAGAGGMPAVEGMEGMDPEMMKQMQQQMQKMMKQQQGR